MRKIKTGGWRGRAMEVVSGPEGRPKVHFEAPEAERVGPEMKGFLTWYEDKTADIEPLIKTGLAHLYFVTIHPLEGLMWFLGCLRRAIAKANHVTAAVLAKAAFWRHLRQESIQAAKGRRKEHRLRFGKEGT
jgi:Fic family protein